MNSNDYGTCVITFDNRGKATVKVTGKCNFEGYKWKGNSTNMECIKSDVSEPTSRICGTINDKPIVSMNNMFNQSKATSIDLSSFDTSNVTDMSGMFYYSITTTGYARSQEDADRFNASSNKPSELTFVVKS